MWFWIIDLLSNFPTPGTALKCQPAGGTTPDVPQASCVGWSPAGQPHQEQLLIPLQGSPLVWKRKKERTIPAFPPSGLHKSSDFLLVLPERGTLAQGLSAVGYRAREEGDTWLSLWTEEMGEQAVPNTHVGFLCHPSVILTCFWNAKRRRRGPKKGTILSTH